MTDRELWRGVVGFSKYVVSNYGAVKHLNRMEPRKCSINDKGFPIVVLFKEDSKTRYVRQLNQLVASAFVPTTAVREGTLIDHVQQDHVWHRDGDLGNCRADNMMWATRAAVYEWNRMHRELTPAFKTPRVQNNRTGEIYDNAFECGMAEGELESKIMWRIEKQADTMYDDSARYRYL